MKFGVIGNISKPVIKTVASNLFSYFNEKNISFSVHEELGNWYNAQGIIPEVKSAAIVPESELPKNCEILIALGGDGTMLTAARIIGQTRVPILGVNLGKLGFLAEVSIDELQECINDIILKKYHVEERMVLRATAGKDVKSYFALNDIVIDKGSSSRIIDLEIYVNDEYLVTFTADGIIISTPTGSTAYSLASGGPIITPQSNVIEINPIAPHTLSARPVIIPENSTVKIVVRESPKSVHMASDGQIDNFYPTPIEFIITRAPYIIRLVKRKKRSYYDLLRMKLMWGKDVRTGGNERGREPK
jgi:NAD+ kinase